MCRIVLLTVLLVGAEQLNSAALESKPPALTSAPALSKEDKEAAALLAVESAAKQFKVSKDEKLSLVAVERLDGKASAESRDVVVSHYRYKDDSAILTTVDLAKKSVVRQIVSAMTTLPLSNEEAQRARVLALNDPTVKELVKGQVAELRINALVVRPRRGEPAFAHRVAHLFLRVGRKQIEPIIEVDLTDERVRVIQPGGGKRDHE